MKMLHAYYIYCTNPLLCTRDLFFLTSVHSKVKKGFERAINGRKAPWCVCADDDGVIHTEYSSIYGSKYYVRCHPIYSGCKKADLYLS